MEEIIIRRAELRDIPEAAEMCHCLWPQGSLKEHARELARLLAGASQGSLPSIVFVAQGLECRLVGFLEVGLRSHADGCDPAHPVGYIEGWYVRPTYRRSRVGAKLVVAAEEWARSQGCVEMASDAWLNALDSQRAHEALGFEIVDRCVHYRKSL